VLAREVSPSSMLQRTTQLVPRYALGAARRGAASHAAAGGGVGSLCSDYTFTRIFGTPGASEPILRDLLEAWGEARSCGGGGGDTLFGDVSIANPKVLDGAPPRSKGELLVDVRAKDSGSNFIVEVQHRVEPLFPHRAVLYAAADLVTQHMSEAQAGTDVLRPVHSLAFCDYDYARGSLGTGIGSSLNAWRKSRPHMPDVARSVHAFDLQPRAADMEYLNQHVNTALAAEMAARMSFVFVLLPHAPRLSELTPSTPRIMQWASLIAHLRADNVDAVPRHVRHRKGVELLLGTLCESVDETELEAQRTRNDLALQERAVMCALAEGKAEGKAEGMAEVLHLQGVKTVKAYRARFGTDPPPQLAPFLVPD
jgi:hypothetical protein